MDSNDLFAKLEQHLSKPDEIEIILLKGHLILEQILNFMLLSYFKSEKELADLSLPFAKKLDLFVALYGSEWEQIKHMREVNRIRNKLAHQLDFSHFHPDLKRWACSVLGYTPKTLNTRRTYRNTVTKSFYMLSATFSGRAFALPGFLERANKSFKPMPLRGTY